jgi:monofunctional glycosyltransferase
LSQRHRHFGENFETKPRGRRKRAGIGRWIGRLFLLGVFLLILPYLLILLYRIEIVRPWSTLMAYGLVTGQGVERTWVPFEDVAPVLVQSVMMSEDGQFCAHDGIDWEALNKVIDGALEGESTRGASTIPMQTAKNLFLWPGRSFVRKALEVPLAMASDYIWPKQRMMEIYLNIAEWAPGVYGIEAAAQHHFGVSAANLNASQSALLAVSLPNPHQRNAGSPGDGLRRLAGNIEGRARQSGAYITCLYG